MAKITVLETSTLWAVLDPVDAGPDGDSIGADGEGEMGADPPPAIAEGISAERMKDVVAVGGVLGELMGYLLLKVLGGKDGVLGELMGDLLPKVLGGKDGVLGELMGDLLPKELGGKDGALGEVERNLSAKELKGMKGAVPVGGVLGVSTCFSLGDDQGLTHEALHNDEAATRLRQLVTHGESETEVGMGAIGGVDRPGDKGKETENEELHGISMRELQRGSTENKETPNAGVTSSPRLNGSMQEWVLFIVCV
ncbi:hypothetical protein B0H13DRAFT_1866689 [Mycena leptocephala]|nr:hypothetical protein B0H13DRAFT_1866689 [Mycena leptocephala]